MNSDLLNQEHISDLLRNAQSNGYYIEDNVNYTEIARDIISYSEGFEDCQPEDLVPFIRTFFES